MSTASLQNASSATTSQSATRSSSGRWILNSWMDLLLFVSTPILVLPLILSLRSHWVGIDGETIGLIVAAFGALGHHLPGMIRAYGDRVLFHRFRTRFVVAPLFLAVTFVPISNHLDAMKLVLLLWGCWHGLMQVYGLVRIYDSKVGSIASVTAYWDWLMCLSWFSSAVAFSDAKMASLLKFWYLAGGMPILPDYIQVFRWTCLAISIAVFIGFLINHVYQTFAGKAPNPVKLLMLMSGIGCWWVAVVAVKEIILGVALFEICHDVQYLAIVWLYNCGRVKSTVDVGGFMRFLFRGGSGMLTLYIGLVLAYGMLGLVPHLTQNETLITSITGITWVSTILHYYYDGFIWKVREETTRAS